MSDIDWLDINNTADKTQHHSQIRFSPNAGMQKPSPHTLECYDVTCTNSTMGTHPMAMECSLLAEISSQIPKLALTNAIFILLELHEIPLH